MWVLSIVISLVWSALIERCVLMDNSNGVGGTGIRTRDSLLFQYIIVWPALSDRGDQP